MKNGLMRIVCAWLLLESWLTPSTVRSATTVLIEDPSFSRGITVFDPKPGKHVTVGKLTGIHPSEEPAWGLAQWGSHFSIADSTPEKVEGGGIRYSNQAKTVVIGADGTLILAVDSRPEYADRSRKQGESWPHLLVEQSFESRCPRLSRLKGAPFHIEARLNRAERFELEGYTPDLHAAQFLVYFTVQNRDSDSPGYGDFLWLGVCVYDDRGHTEKSVIEGDVALGKLIYTPARSDYTDRPVTTGEWTTYRADLLPLAKDALAEAWRRGFLIGSQEISDYTLSGMNLGWEVPGVHDVEMEVRNLNLYSF